MSFNLQSISMHTDWFMDSILSIDTKATLYNVHYVSIMGYGYCFCSITWSIRPKQNAPSGVPAAAEAPITKIR